MRRVVVTGTGVVSPVGNNSKDFFDSLVKGRHGIAPIAAFDAADFEVKLAAEVKGFDPAAHGIGKKDARRMDRFSQFALAAAIEAMTDCGTGFQDLDPFRVGVIVGTGIGGFVTIGEEYEKYLEKGPDRVSVFFIPMIMANAASALISMRYGFQGPNYSLATACATSTHTVGEAFRTIKDGYADVILCGGSEAAVIRFAMAGFNNMKALSNSQDPDSASIPFDARRDGFVLGEGAGVLVLEEYEHARARGAHIYAEVVGYGATADAYHITSPDPEGTGDARAITLALEEAGIAPGQLGYINAHGTATPLNDRYETIAIRRALGEAAEKVKISSTKSMTGHLLGAAGAIEAAATVLALDQGIFPGTAGFREPDPECDLDYMVAGAEQLPVEYALSNSLGFGGHNAAILFRAVKD